MRHRTQATTVRPNYNHLESSILNRRGHVQQNLKGHIVLKVRLPCLFVFYFLYYIAGLGAI